MCARKRHIVTGKVMYGTGRLHHQAYIIDNRRFFIESVDSKRRLKS